MNDRESRLVTGDLKFDVDFPQNVYSLRIMSDITVSFPLNTRAMQTNQQQS